MAETYFALHYHYAVPKSEAQKALLELLESGFARLESKGVAVTALKAALSSSGKIGFVDRMIHAQYHAIPAVMVSFEKAAARLADAEILHTFRR